MTKDEIVRKNMELLEEFHRYGLEHPEVFEQIPRDAYLILLPEDDLVLRKINEGTVEECKRSGKKYAVFQMKMPERSAPRLVEAA